jgi:hypothetical protein
MLRSRKGAETVSGAAARVEVTFKPQNFRRIESDSKPWFKIRTADHTTLILVKDSGAAMYGRTRGDKGQIIEQFDAAKDLLLWAWVGQHHTDIFQLTEADVKEHYR